MIKSNDGEEKIKKIRKEKKKTEYTTICVVGPKAYVCAKNNEKLIQFCKKIPS